MKLKNKKIIIIAVSIFCIVAALIYLVFLLKQPEDRLTEEQIAALREEYPIRELVFAPMIDGFNPPLKVVKQLSDSFVYAEVIKAETTVIREDFIVNDYTFSVIADSENKCKKGEIITLSEDSATVYSEPPLKVGMKIVFAIRKDETEDQYHYSGGCEYYVTDDGYVLSTFDEEKSHVVPPLSGIKFKKLMRELKK